jgi:pentose-5-phosphate-3-epimerase/putative flippase GtrA
MSEHEPAHLLPFPIEGSGADTAQSTATPEKFAIVRCDQPASSQHEEITGLLVGPMGRVLRLLDHHGLGYLLYRYRYLACFAVIGFFSIVFESWLMRNMLPRAWSLTAQSTVAFCVSIVVSFALNAFVNFQVSWRHLLRTFAWFVLISSISFALNMAVVRSIYGLTGEHYHRLRLLSAGALFIVGYTLHRRFTFSQARDFGLAIYACDDEDPQRLFNIVGRNCDHVHVDLIDETMSVKPSPVRLENVSIARNLWRGCPVVLHIMSLRPRQWVEKTWDDVDSYLFHLEAEEDLFELMFACREQRKRVGVVWRPGISAATLMPYLSHVDYVMVLGIREPGRSGQKICAESIAMASTLNRLCRRYGFELMFDGGVKASNVGEIEAKYIVAASGVLNAEHPIKAAHVLRSGAKYHRAPRYGSAPAA